MNQDLSQVKEFLLKNSSQGMKAFTEGAFGKLFGAGAIAELFTAENKLKTIKELIITIVAFRPMLAALGVGMLSGMVKGIRTLVKDTGSLEAALKRLSKIQVLQKTFEPLAGGAEAAKKKIAELTVFSARFNKTLDETGEAARSLTILTNGAFDGAEALKMIGDAAAGTANDFVQMADAVGSVYVALQKGTGLESSLEQLRDMGAISQSTANQMMLLKDSGASNAMVFQTLKDSMSQFNGSMDGIRGTVGEARKEMELAAQALQEKFGSPFVEDDVENTKNWTAAMKALAPSVEKVAAVLAAIANGFSTFWSSLAKAVAQSNLLRGAIEKLIIGLSGLVAAIGVVSGAFLLGFLAQAYPMVLKLASGLAGLTTQLFGAGAAATFAANAVRLLVAATGVIGLVVAALGTIATIGSVLWGAYKGAAAAIAESRKELERLKSAHEQVNSAMERQINNMLTMQDRADALAKALKNLAEAENELAKARDQGKSPEEIEERKKQVEARKAAVETILGKDQSEFLPSEAEEQRVRQEIERNKMLEEQDFQNRYDRAGPEERVKLLKQRQEKLRNKVARGEVGLIAKQDAEQQRFDTEAKYKVAQSKLDNINSAENAERRTQRDQKIEELSEEIKRPGNRNAKLIRIKKKELERLRQIKIEEEKQIAKATEERDKAKADYIASGKGYDYTTTESALRLAELYDAYDEARKKEESLNDQLAELEKSDIPDEEKNKKLKELTEQRDAAATEALERKETARKEYARANKFEKYGPLAKETSAAYEQQRLELIASGKNDPEKLAELNRKIEEARKIDEEYNQNSAQLSETNKQIKQAEKELDLATKLAEIEKQRTEMKERGYAASLRDIELQKQAAKARLAFEKDVPEGAVADQNAIKSLESEITALSNREEDIRREQAHAEDIARLEKEKAELRSQGYQRTQDEARIEEEILKKQLAYEQENAKRTNDQTKVKDIEAQLAELSLRKEEAARGFVRGQQGLSDSEERMRIALRGDADARATLNDYDVYEQQRAAGENSGLSREEAARRAREYAMSSILVSAREEGAQVRSMTTATELARIGGGGNIGAGNAAIDIAKRQVTLLEKIEKNTGQEKTAEKEARIK